jgi:DNA-binding MurR/RpiR family transcriptional regulator
VPQDLTVAEEIRTRFETLTRAERQLANALMENYPVLGLGNITEVAQASGVSTPTVVRMAKKLGFAGFPELQATLRSELRETISNPIAKHDRWAESAPETHILNKFADAVIDNMRQTLRQVSPATFDEVTGLLSDQDREIYLVGGRITRSLADYFFTHLQVIRDHLTLVAANSNTWPHYLLNMKKGDVLIVFDIRRYEHNMLRFAEMAREKGVTIVLFTDQWGSPISKHATHSFHSRIEAPSAWDSSVITLVIVESLISAIQSATWKQTRHRIKDLEELFDRTKQFRKFT